MCDPHAATRPDLVLRGFRPGPAAVETRWCGDITYIATGEGWLHPLATDIDIASRRVAGRPPPATCEPNPSPTHSQPPAGPAARPDR
ncbi:hypothetical protein [Streptomyces sp. NPDC008121]|uniref:hypothetical protein n=1 Tax=Streptomyces sp. NPDC008121 TaxID=3364809 RepID=UPI0036E6C72C